MTGAGERRNTRIVVGRDSVPPNTNRPSEGEVLYQYVVALVVAGALIAAGCGGSPVSKSGVSRTASAIGQAGTSPTGTPTSAAAVTVASGKPLSHRRWISLADGTCAQLASKLGSTPIKSEQDYARVLPVAISYERSELVELAKLQPPVSRTKDWQEYLTGTQESIANTARVAEYARSSSFTLSDSRIKSIIVAGAGISEHLRQIARRDGLKACAGV
jgi:hypothetical protein